MTLALLLALDTPHTETRQRARLHLLRLRSEIARRRIASDQWPAALARQDGPAARFWAESYGIFNGRYRRREVISWRTV